MSAGLLEMATAYQRTAVLAAAVETGIADALAEGRKTPEALAAACGTDVRGTVALLGALTAMGLAEPIEGGFTLTKAGAPLARSDPDTVAEIVAKEWFFYRVWGGLAQTVRDGHARIPSWRQRLREDPDAALSFLRALDDLASRFGNELPDLADLRDADELLDVGGGAGSHAAALAAAVSGLKATVLDLPAVEPLVDERHPELEFIAGDLDQPRFGCPAEARWDAVLLANILHDHPAERCARYVQTATDLLAPGGTLLVYEWLIDPDRQGPPEAALFTLMMMVENEGGSTWTADEIGGWISAAGLVDLEVRRGNGPIAVLRARQPGSEEPTTLAQTPVRGER